MHGEAQRTSVESGLRFCMEARGRSQVTRIAQKVFSMSPTGQKFSDKAKNRRQGDRMALYTKAPIANSDDPSLIPSTCMEEGKNGLLPRCPDTPPNMQACTQKENQTPSIRRGQ